MPFENHLEKSKTRILILYLGIICSFNVLSCSDVDHSVHFAAAEINGALANEGFRRCQQFVHGWLAEADPQTGLIPRNLHKDRDIWNAHDCGADNYPFMVLTSAFTDTALFHSRMPDMLHRETELTSRLGAIPDVYSFSKSAFVYEDINLARLMFGGSEYIKDGLLPLTEWLGPSPWSERMLNILDDMWRYAPITTPAGRIVSTNVEVNGEMLQVLSRLYWMTGKEDYLDYALRLGDYYLLGTHHPTRNFQNLRLRDHGCEIISGLCELYATTRFARPHKNAEYQKPLYEMLDRILEIGRNEDGLFYNSVNPQTGEILNPGIADTWGYTFNGFYTIYLLDHIDRYRQAVLLGLANLDKYMNFDWEHGSADGYADAVESAINLYNREMQPDVAAWIDSEIQVMWQKQQDSGVIEGWHGDGNFARTTIMYCLWKAQGLSLQPWRNDVQLGAVHDGNTLYISLKAKKPWSGRLIFDRPRHKTIMKLPLDWPRINQFPEWFTVQPQQTFQVVINGELTRRNLEDGLPVQFKSDKVYIIIKE